MTPIEWIAALGLLWGVFTYTEDVEPQCYVVVSEQPYRATWVNKSELKDGLCEVPEDMKKQKASK